MSMACPEGTPRLKPSGSMNSPFEGVLTLLVRERGFVCELTLFVRERLSGVVGGDASTLRLLSLFAPSPEEEDPVRSIPVCEPVLEGLRSSLGMIAGLFMTGLFA
mmetsp:Transcript_33738/g.79665  ORF Transcript_33738/g.79665 Transcript_33738/m.79665 type:complete len:105 (+) Transcript_33738:422-736(+)